MNSIHPKCKCVLLHILFSTFANFIICCFVYSSLQIQRVDTNSDNLLFIKTITAFEFKFKLLITTKWMCHCQNKKIYTSRLICIYQMFKGWFIGWFIFELYVILLVTALIYQNYANSQSFYKTLCNLNERYQKWIS